MELEWPYKRHYETFAGIQEYMMEQESWELYLTDFPQVEISRGAHFDGIVGRITKPCLDAAVKANIPIVNVTIGTPHTDKMHCVHVDFRAAGRLAAEHLIIRGLHRIVHIGFKNSVASALHYKGVKEVADERNNISCSSHLVRHTYSQDDKCWEAF